MGFKCGIVGLPNVGKSILFNAMAMGRTRSDVKNYQFSTVQPTVGVVPVPDERVDKLTEISSSVKTTYTTMEFVDIAGLVKGSSRGEGMGNQFLAAIREADALVHVVRFFKNPDVMHIEDTLDPVRDAAIIDTELLLTDYETVEKRIEKVKRQAKSGDKKFQAELVLLDEILELLGQEVSGRIIRKDPKFDPAFKEMHLLTTKPVLYVANVTDYGIEEDQEGVKQLEEYAAQQDAIVVVIAGQIEAEIADIEDKEEREEFMKELEIESAGLSKLIRAGYKLLKLVTYFTTGPEESRAWTIKENTKAPQAAGKIHTDIEKGFIKADVMRYEDLVELGSEQAVKEKGLERLEGKEYIMKDGDVVLFKFNK